MNKLILPILLVLLLVSTQAVAQDPIYRQVPIGVPCGAKYKISKNLEIKFGEKPMAQGMGSTRFLPNTQSLPGLVRIWTNTSSWTFTITIESVNSNVMCVLNVGTGLEPFIPGTPVGE